MRRRGLPVPFYDRDGWRSEKKADIAHFFIFSTIGKFYYLFRLFLYNVYFSVGD